MEEIIRPVDKELIKSELSSDKWLRKANFGNRDIYVITSQDSPNTMQEIGRLREISFRDGGGGTGKKVDIDDLDLSPVMPYKQLIVWDCDDEQIVGGYRYLEGNLVPTDESGVPQIATAELFKMSDRFVNEYLPRTIELGRSFVQPFYQSGADPRKGVFSLDNLWDGLGALINKYPNIEYFFGKITMYTCFNIEARDLILYFLKVYFPDQEQLVWPIKAVELQTDTAKLAAVFEGLALNEAFVKLGKEVRARGESIPPLVGAYIKLSSTMKSFGTSVNEHFGGVEETGILIKIDDIYPSKKHRHVEVR